MMSFIHPQIHLRDLISILLRSHVDVAPNYFAMTSKTNLDSHPIVGSPKRAEDDSFRLSLIFDFIKKNFSVALCQCHSFLY